MAPWEELPFFDLPREGTAAGTTIGSKLVSADPMRVLLMMSVTGGTTTGLISTKPNPVSGNGILLGTTAPLILTAKDHPGLCQSAWYVAATSTAQYYFISVSMLKWPQLAPAIQRRYRQAYPDSRIREIMGDVPK